MRKILAIDDKMDNLTTLSALLKNLMPDCEVITAKSGREGIDKAVAALPDVILLDVKMPDMDGFETCRRLMADDSTKCIPVIMITAINSDPKTRVIGLDCGANAFLSKPIDQHELVSQVKVALRIKKAEDALLDKSNSLETIVQERTKALAKSEANYRMLFHETLAGFARNEIICDPQGRPINSRYLDINPAFERITGLKAEEVVGKTILDVFPSLEPSWIEIFGRVALTGEPAHFEKEAAVLGIWFDVMAFSPEPNQYACTFTDITERKRAEEKIIKQLEELQRWQDVMLDREDRIIELKKEVNEQLARAGQPPRYPSAVAENSNDMPDGSQPLKVAEE